MPMHWIMAAAFVTFIGAVSLFIASKIPKNK